MKTKEQVQQNCEVRRQRWVTRDQIQSCRLCNKPALIPTRKCARHQLLARLTQVKLKYGLEPDEYQELVERFVGKCYICKQVPLVYGLSTDRTKASRTLAVDHCHETGKIRGLLCSHCNQGIGHFRHNPELLQQAVGYLKG